MINLSDKIIKILESRAVRCAVVDDDATFLGLMKNFLEGLGMDVFCSNDGHEVIKEHRSKPFEIAFVTWNCQKMDGGLMLDIMDKHPPAPHPIIVLGEGNVSFRTRVNVSAFLLKPFGADGVMRCLNKSIG